MKYILLFFLVFFKFTPYPTSTTWDKDAGLILPFTQNARLSASSNPEQLLAILDGNRETSWQSGAPFPEAYIKRKDLNIFYKNEHSNFRGSKISNPNHLFDTDLNSHCQVHLTEGKAELKINLSKAGPIRFFSIKAGHTEPIQINFLNENNKPVSSKNLGKENSYQLIRFEIEEKVKEIKLTSTAAFQIFEIAGTAGLPVEYVQLDLGDLYPVGIVNCRYWPGHQTARKVSLLLSQDRSKWNKVADLDPNGLQNLIIDVKPQQKARFIRLEYELEPKDWNKVYCWEISAYDENGHYGPMPNAEPSTVNLNNMLGVNGIWGWGTNQYSDLLPAGQGPSLYAPVASHARNYHDMRWDVADPDHTPNYHKMALGKGTEVQWWLNWDQEYYAWLKNGLNVQATIQIHNFKPTDWDKPYESAYTYASNFAAHFGTGKGNGLVCTFEAGNEPWKYDAETYREILFGMAKGVKETDPELEMFPCALQAADPSMEETTIFKNYMGARITPREAAFLDGINIHAYSYVSKPDGGRKAVHPEHPHSTFREIFNAIRFRNKNLPGKKIYLSEWGWDNAGGGEDCTHDVCVSESEGAVYAVRAALMSQRLGIDRATWYFYANSDEESSLYTRSGLTGTGRTGFKKKKVYFALQSLLHHCGDSFFLKTIQEDEQAWIYLMGDSKGSPTHLIAWRPVELKDEKTETVVLDGPFEAKNTFRIDGAKNSGTQLPSPTYSNGQLILEVDATPLIIALKNE